MQALGVNHQKAAPEIQIMIPGVIQTQVDGASLQEMKANLLLSQIPGVNHQRMKQSQPILLGVMIQVAKQSQEIMTLAELGVLQEKRKKKIPVQMHGETTLQRALGVILKVLRGNHHGVKVEEMMMEIPDQETEDALTVAKKDTEQVIAQNQNRKDQEAKWNASSVAKKVTDQVSAQILMQNSRIDQEAKWNASSVAKKVIDQVSAQTPTQNNRIDQGAEDALIVVKKDIELAIAQNQNKSGQEARLRASNVVKKVIAQTIVQARVLEVAIVPEDETQEAEVEVRRKNLQEWEIEVVVGKEEVVKIVVVNQEKEAGIHPETQKETQVQAPGEILMIAGVNPIRAGGIVAQRTKTKHGAHLKEVVELQSMTLGVLLKLQL